MLLTAAVTLHPADFEEVGIIGIEFENEGLIDSRTPEVIDPNAIVTGRLPKNSGAKNMKGPLRDDHVTIARHIEIGKIDSEQRVVLFDCGAQQQEPLVADAQRELREKTSV